MLDLESKMYVAFGMSLKSEKEALIRFKVENSWLGSNNLAGSDIKMVQWDGSK